MSERHHPRIRILNAAEVNASDSFKKLFSYPVEENNDSAGDPIEIYNHHLTVKLDKNGFAKSIKLCGIPHKFNLGFYRYRKTSFTVVLKFAKEFPFS